jgi:thymidylate synthase ThyX
MIEVSGECGISVKVIADSIDHLGNRITTVEKVFPRIILAEENTHRMESKNSASSRAIPTKKMIELIQTSPFIPNFIGKNQSGMQAKEQLKGEAREQFLAEWNQAKDDAIRHLQNFEAMGAHKQLASRVTEAWMMMKTVNTATERANYLWLRDHSDAQPEIRILAECLREALEQSSPTELYPGEWHMPYVKIEFDKETDEISYWSENEKLSLDEALKLSASCCAQVSYRQLNTDLDKAFAIYDRMVSADRSHSSPFEHQATPINSFVNPFNPHEWPAGVTHVKRDGSLWSANFRGWIQHRQLIPNHTVWG